MTIQQAIIQQAQAFALNTVDANSLRQLSERIGESEAIEKGAIVIERLFWKDNDAPKLETVEESLKLSADITQAIQLSIATILHS